MTDNKKTVTKMVHLPLEKEVLASIKGMAEKSERTILGEIRYAIKRHIEQAESK